MYEWLLYSIAWLLIWLMFYTKFPRLRKEMLSMGFVTAIVGLTEPLFVPEYWSPQSLFNLNAKIGFDIESIIFCFALGGVASVLYEAAAQTEHKKIRHSEANIWFHFLSLSSFPVLFVLLIAFTPLNPIYSLILSMLVGGILGIVCRPDLLRMSIVGGLLFTNMYFIFFLAMNYLTPDFLSSWNLKAVSELLIMGIPIEELLFAFTFGMISSGIYDHFMGYSNRKSRASRGI